MNIRKYNTPDEVAVAGAEFVFESARRAIRERNQFALALSGGNTPWNMLRKLAECDLPWDRVSIVQVDERVAPDGDESRNLGHIRETLTDRIGLPPGNLLAMPVDCKNLDDATRQYAFKLSALAGEPAVLDLVHLGLGEDGHTASLVPGDAALDTNDCDVAITGMYCGQRRMTLSYPIINRARRILWMITGASKSDMLNRLIQADINIPAGRVRQRRATVIADAAALSG